MDVFNKPDAIEERARLRLYVAKALLEDRVFLAFQPVVRTRPAFQIAFRESLVRIEAPDGTTVPAGVFMPLLEETALGEALDCAVLRLCIDALRRFPTLRLSINVGARAVTSAEWWDRLIRAKAEDSLLIYRLIVEVTERTALDDIDRASIFAERLHKLGATVALDDFGAGATAIRHLSDLRFDILKIDGSFLPGLSRSPDNRAMVRAMVRLAQHFEMLTVAEYAENPADIEIAERLGVDLFQGYRYGRPSAELKDINSDNFVSLSRG